MTSPNKRKPVSLPGTFHEVSARCGPLLPHIRILIGPATGRALDKYLAGGVFYWSIPGRPKRLLIPDDIERWADSQTYKAILSAINQVGRDIAKGITSTGPLHIGAARELGRLCLIRERLQDVFVRRNNGLIVKLAHRTGSPMDGATAAALAALARAMRTFDPFGSAAWSTWAYPIVSNELRGEHRLASRAARELPRPITHEPEPEPLEAMIHAERVRAVAVAVRRLPAVVLRDALGPPGYRRVTATASIRAACPASLFSVA